MNPLLTLYLSLLMMTGLWAIAMVVPQSGNIYYLVRLPKKNPQASSLAGRYRTRALDAALLFFILISILEYLLPSMIFLSGGVSLWLLIFVFLYYDDSRTIIKIKQELKDDFGSLKIKEAKSPILSLSLRHCLLQVFLLWVQFYFTIVQIKKSAYSLPNSVFFIPVTTLFFLGFLAFAALLIKWAPPLATPGIKSRFYQVIYTTALWVSLLFLSLQGILLFAPSLSLIFFFITVPGLFFYGSLILLFKLKQENRPYGFFVSHPKKPTLQDGILTTSADGTRIYLNTTNKKSRLIPAGLAVYMIAYFLIMFFIWGHKSG